MSTIPPPLNESKKGLSGFAIAGFGCLALVILVGIAGMMVINKAYHKIKEVAEESGGNPAKIMAKLAVTANPDLEIVTMDEAKGEIVLRDKKTGKSLTMPMNEAANSKLTLQEADGKTTTLDISEAANGGGKMTIQGPDGKTVVAGGTTALPSWVPAFPGSQAVEGGGFSSETPEGVAGMHSATSTEPIAKVKEFYESKLKEAGFETQVNSLNSDGKETVTISGSKDENKTNVNLILITEDGKTAVTTSYQAPKP